MQTDILYVCLYKVHLLWYVLAGSTDYNRFYIYT